MSEHQEPLRQSRYLVLMTLLVDEGDGKCLQTLESQVRHVHRDLIFDEPDLETEAHLLATFLRHVEMTPP